MAEIGFEFNLTKCGILCVLHGEYQVPPESLTLNSRDLLASHHLM